MRYRKRPLVIDAIRNEGEWKPIRDWLDAEARSRGLSAIVRRERDGTFVIETRGGTMRCDVGDWIIRGVEGELSPCPDSVFTTTYEPAPLPASPR